MGRRENRYEQSKSVAGDMKYAIFNLQINFIPGNCYWGQYSRDNFIRHMCNSSKNEWDLKLFSSPFAWEQLNLSNV